MLATNAAVHQGVGAVEVSPRAEKTRVAHAPPQHLHMPIRRHTHAQTVCSCVDPPPAHPTATVPEVGGAAAVSAHGMGDFLCIQTVDTIWHFAVFEEQRFPQDAARPQTCPCLDGQFLINVDYRHPGSV